MTKASRKLLVRLNERQQKESNVTAFSLCTHSDYVRQIIEEQGGSCHLETLVEYLRRVCFPF
jgi:hypothetical protein